MSGSLRRIIPVLLLLAAGVLANACANAVSQQGGDGGNTCEDNSDCRSGYHCDNSLCVPNLDGGVEGDGSAGHPAIFAEPPSLVFDEAVQGAPQTQSVTVTNLGDGTLHLLNISVSEDDPVVEFSFQPPAQTALAPDESVTIDITLSPTDDNLDTGQLRIESNDPVSPVVVVNLFSSWIGTPDLALCVQVEQPPPNCEDPPVMSFGTDLPYGSSSHRSFYVRNAGDGNKTITVESLAVHTTFASHDPLYTVDLFTMVENPPNSGNWQEAPAALPFTLVATDGLEPDPTALYGRVTFTADTDGFLILSGDELRITTTDTDDPNPRDSTVPITATIAGCPPGMYNYDGNAANGCEYACTVTNGGVEACDGLDNDCDGTTDDFTEACYDAGDGGCAPNGTNCQGICQPGTRTCTAGTWSPCNGQVVGQTEVCDDLDNNCNGQVNENLDVGGDSCNAPLSVNALPDGTGCTTRTRSGNLIAGNDDWYAITFQSAQNSTNFNARIRFTTPVGGGNVWMDVLQEDCSGAGPCGTGSNVQLHDFEWHINSQGKCTGNTNCYHTLNLRVRVYKIGGATCIPYTLEITHGAACP